MASSSPNKLLVGRAAAILTNSEVAAVALDLNLTWGGHVCVDLDFTLGSLTNVIVRFYVSSDGVTYKPLSDGTALLTETITANATRGFSPPCLAGWKFFRVTLQGTGTLTSSSAAVNYRYLQRGSQA